MNNTMRFNSLLIVVVALVVRMTAVGQVACFDKGLDGWKAWGEGDSSCVSTLGHAAPGCVALECGRGQVMTLHREFALKPGRYLVSAWLRGADIQDGLWGFAVWLFYSVGGDDTTTVVKDIKGTFEWSRVSYTLDVPAESKKTDIWIRLKAAGLLWIDDISVEPYAGEPVKYRFDRSESPFPKPNPVGVGLMCENCYRWWAPTASHCLVCGAALVPVAGGGVTNALASQPAERLLLGFEPESQAVEAKRFPQREPASTSATQGKYSGVVRFGRYNNLTFQDPEMRDWSGYDYIGMDVFNPLPTLESFNVTISDMPGSSYWNQLNHVTRLAPGWNQLRFHVNRYVGERGSVKIKRYLDLHNIHRMWFAIAPENKRQVDAPFLVDNIRLLKAPPAPAPVAGMKAFDFVAEKFRAQRGFLPILENHRYHSDVGFGFIDAHVWRSHDSQYADTLNRDGVFVDSGTFAVDVPDGRYLVMLCVNALGYWNEHFWNHRQVTVEGRVVLDETRTNVASRVADFLRFQDIEPELKDDPYDLYLGELFKPLVTEVEVKDGRLEIGFSGDQSGVCLNWLLVAPVERRPAVDVFLRELRQVQKDEFANLARMVTPAAVVEEGAVSETQRKAELYTALVDSDVLVRPNDILATSGTEIRLEGGVGERPLQSFMVRNLGTVAAPLQLSLSPLVAADGGARILPEPDWVRRAVNQYQCHSYNHETFEIAPRFLRRLGPEGITLVPGRSLMAWCQIPIRAGDKPGTYHGELTVKLGAAATVYPVVLTVHPYVLPPLDVGAGFLGFDLIRFLFNPPPDAAEFSKVMRRNTLDQLACRGFSTWSGLPPADLVRHGTEWRVESPEGDDMMAYAKSIGFNQLVFTYGGGLESVLNLDNQGEIAGVPQADYRRISAAALKVAISNWLPVSVTYSDEAAGYSSAVARDMKRSEILKTHYPFLRRSGATAVHGTMGEGAAELNRQFTDVLLSSQTREEAERIKSRGDKWGFYNMSLGLFTYDRPAFGLGLFVMREHGLDYLLNWALSFANNYPYYDLDGREHDAMMLFPRIDGELCAALKFEWAAQGVEDCRMLMLLQKLAKDAGPRGADSLAWVAQHGSAVDPYAQGIDAYPGHLTHTMKSHDCEALRRETRRRILELVK